MMILTPCGRCDRLRQHLVVARIHEHVDHMWACPECGAAIFPISFKVGAGARPYMDEWLVPLAPTPCPCIARGPVIRAVTVLEPRRLLWVCQTCGTGRWPLMENDGHRGAA